MNNFKKYLRNARLNLKRIESVYRSLEKAGEPDLMSLSIPLVYQHLAEKHKEYGLDEQAIFHVGGLLSGRFPHLQDAIFTREQKKDLERGKRGLDQMMEDTS